jgi:hypothetical protein
MSADYEDLRSLAGDIQEQAAGAGLSAAREYWIQPPLTRAVNTAMTPSCR